MSMLRDALMALGVGAVFGGAAFVGGTAEVHAQPELGRAALEQRARGAVLQGDVAGCSGPLQGSVTVVDLGRGPEGLTNAHVIDGAAEVTLSGPGVMAARAEVAGLVTHRDAARLRLTDADPVVALHPGPRPAAGDPVVVAGYPGGELEVSAAHVVRVEDRTGAGGTSPVLLVDTPARPGASGGVVLDREGRAVGLVVARDPSTGWTVAYPLGEVLGGSHPASTTC